VLRREGIRVSNGFCKLLLLGERLTINRSGFIKDEHEINHSVALLLGAVPLGGVKCIGRNGGVISEFNLLSVGELS